jgi:hypothetical protein
MKFLKIAALVALASLPLLFIKKQKPRPAGPVESEDIFNDELTLE